MSIMNTWLDKAADGYVIYGDYLYCVVKEKDGLLLVRKPFTGTVDEFLTYDSDIHVIVDKEYVKEEYPEYLV